LAEYDYDLFVIGGGSGGVRASRIASSLGARVACAEERYFGGTCVNVGCVPKKLFSYAAHYHDDLEDSRGFGWQTPEVTFDWQQLKLNKDKEINRLEGIYKSILRNSKVDIFEHRATVAGPHEVQVDGRTVSTRYLLIATGGWPWVPEFRGSDLAITSNELFELDTLPDSMLIIGGGYIAVEFATIFARLGCRVSLSYRRDALLSGFDDEVRQFFTREVGRHVHLELESNPERITKKNNKLLTALDNGSEIAADLVLAATGRRPLTGGLGLENTGVELAANGAIVVDDRFATAEPGIFAVGDVIHRVALTPVALAEGQLVARALFAKICGTWNTAISPPRYSAIPTSARWG